MPLTRVEIRRGKPEAYRKAILRNVYEAMHEVFNVPEDDYFMVLNEHDAAEYIFPARLDGIAHSPNTVFIQITCNNTRTAEMKKALFKRIVEKLGKDPGIAPGDVLINLSECVKENWSLGNGVMTFA